MPRLLLEPRGAPGSAVSTPSAPHSSGFSLRRRNLGRHALLRGCRLTERATAPPRRQRLVCRPPNWPRAGCRRCTGVVSPPVAVSAHQLAGAPRACVSAPIAARVQPPPPSQRLAAAAGVQSALPSHLRASTAAAASRMSTGSRRTQQRRRLRGRTSRVRLSPLPASSAPRQRRVLRSTHASCSALSNRLAATTAPPPLPSPQLQLRALQPAQHPVADSFAARLHRIWTLSRTRHPFTRSAHPAHHRLAPSARQRSLPRRPPALHPSSAQAPRRSRRPRLARPRHSSAAPPPHYRSRAPSRVVETLSRKSTAVSEPRTGSTSPAIGTAVAEPPELCTSAFSVAPAAQHAERELRSPASPASRVGAALVRLHRTHRAAKTHIPPSSTTQQTPLPVPAPASPRCHDARRAQLLRALPSPPNIAPLSRAAHRPSASTHRRRHPRPRCASQTHQQPAMCTPLPQSIRRSTHLAAIRLTSAPPVSVAAALHHPRLRSARHCMRSCPQRGVILRLDPVRAPAAPAARPRSPQSRALYLISIQARAQQQHRLANRSSAQADADVAALRVAPATQRAVSAARASRQAADASASPAHHRPPPDRRPAAVQALRSFDGVAVSPACKQQSGPSASCARAARAPGTAAPRGDASM
jgi:hypothetical protein